MPIWMFAFPPSHSSPIKALGTTKNAVNFVTILGGTISFTCHTQNHWLSRAYAPRDRHHRTIQRRGVGRYTPLPNPRSRRHSYLWSRTPEICRRWCPCLGRNTSFWFWFHPNGWASVENWSHLAVGPSQTTGPREDDIGIVGIHASVRGYLEIWREIVSGQTLTTVKAHV